ncbi:MAG: hypothetical protein GX605_08425 [Chloroflexi bacterium]|nr:hypothetical protein [Chloroflexota bacterium]
MLAEYLRKNPPKAGSPAAQAWERLQALPPDEQAAVERLVEFLHVETGRMGLGAALEIVWKVGILWARREFLDTCAEQ